MVLHAIRSNFSTKTFAYITIANITVNIADIFHTGTQHRFSIFFFNDDCIFSDTCCRDEYSNMSPQAHPTSSFLYCSQYF